MKKFTSILLCAMIVLAACANAGEGTESPQSASSQSGAEAVTESTAAGGSTGQENTQAEGEALYEESDGGFISNDTAGETAAGDRTADAAAETEDENNSGLVILGGDEGDCI